MHSSAATPGAYSMLADCCPPSRCARVVTYMSGVDIGSAAVLIVSGLVIQATSPSSKVVIPLLGLVCTLAAVLGAVCLAAAIGPYRRLLAQVKESV